MRTKWAIAIFVLPLLLSFILAIFVFPTQSQENILKTPLSTEPELSAHLELPLDAPSSIATVLFTKTIEAVVPFSEYRFFWQMKISDMPDGEFTWNMDYFNPEHYGDLYFYGIGGNGCVQQSDMDIFCDGVTTFYLEYRYTNIYTLQLNQKEIGMGANFTGFSLNHYLTLHYVEPLVFIRSFRSATNDPITPTLHENQTLKWEILNASQGGMRSVFLDPRIETIFLPIQIN